ncbi:MAG TPA: DUF3181 family protein [Allocoleopsis sp.]
MAKTNTTEFIEDLAADIGKEVYIDIAKWHLYLSDAHLATVVAQRVYPLLTNNTLEESEVLKVLADISVPLGGGKREVPLIDLLPTRCQVNLMDLLEEYQRKL